MKRLSLLRKIALGSGIVAAVSPIALMTTSCAIEDAYAEYIDCNSILENYSYSNAWAGKVSYKKLLFGSKKVNDGNYILLTGSSMFNKTCKFFSGDEHDRTRSHWFTNWTAETPYGKFDDSPFFYGIQKIKGSEHTNFGIFIVVDFWDGKVYDKKGHQIFISDKENKLKDVIGPFEKWTSGTIECTKRYNKSENVPTKYEWDEKSVSDKEYIRNDTAAVYYREFIATAAKVYPVTADRKNTFEAKDNVAKMLVFKDGKLKSKSKDDKDKQDVLDMPEDKDAWYEIIKTHFITEEK